MTRYLLTVNAGSSSVKLGAFRLGSEGLAAEFRAWLPLNARERRLRVQGRQGEAVQGPLLRPGRRGGAQALAAALSWCEAELGSPVDGVGHRIVHGGDSARPQLVTEEVLRRLQALAPLAPLHQPAGLAGIAALRRQRPGLAQAAAFDTAFHRSHDELADAFALPRTPQTAGLRRFGFHGLSYEHVSERLREVAPGARRVVAAHLGSGASLCAIQDGRSVDSTMGATPLDGLVMSTRCGALDPGVVLYLQQAQGLSADQVADLLYRRSGLLGVSGRSGDMRELLACEAEDPRARTAVDLFVFRVARETAALAATLGGLDALVFTGGIGENAPEVRARVCARLAWLGVILKPDDVATPGERELSAGRSAVAVWTIPTDEERVIARHTCDVLGLAGGGDGEAFG